MEPSFMQREAMMSRFDGGEHERELAQRRADVQAQIDADLAARYDAQAARQVSACPAEDPDADWGGYVARRGTRKQFARDQTLLREGLTREEDGIVGADAAGEPGAAGGRKHFARDPRFQSVDPAAQGAPLGSAVYQQGPGSRHAADEWQTTYQAEQGRQEQQQQRRQQQEAAQWQPGAPERNSTRRRVKPSFEQEEEALRQRRAEAARPVRPTQTAMARGSGSLLAGLGRQLAREIDADLPAPRLPSQQGSRHKEDGMILDNYHRAMPGYSGGRYRS